MKPKLFDDSNEGKLFVLSAPSGTGKTTLVNKLIKEFPKKIVRSVTYTTRPKRPKEKEGKDYHFVLEKEFLQKIEKKHFLEYVKLFGYFYGTDEKEILKSLSQGKYVFLVIDTQGATKLMQRKIPSLVSIFLYPPSKKVLLSRLQKRGCEDKKEMALRLEQSSLDLEKAKHFDYHILNKDLSIAYDVLRAIVIAEQHRS